MGHKFSVVQGVKSENFYEQGNAINEIWVGDFEIISRLPFGDSDIGQAGWPPGNWPKIPWHQFIIPLKRDLSSAQCSNLDCHSDSTVISLRNSESGLLLACLGVLLLLFLLGAVLIIVFLVSKLRQARLLRPHLLETEQAHAASSILRLASINPDFAAFNTRATVASGLAEISRILTCFQPTVLAYFSFHKHWNPFYALFVGLSVTGLGFALGFRMTVASDCAQRHRKLGERIVEADHYSLQKNLEGLRFYYGLMIIHTACEVPVCLLMVSIGVRILLFGVRELTAEALAGISCACLSLLLVRSSMEEIVRLVRKYRRLRTLCLSREPRVQDLEGVGGDGEKED